VLILSIVVALLAFVVSVFVFDKNGYLLATFNSFVAAIIDGVSFVINFIVSRVTGLGKAIVGLFAGSPAPVAPVATAAATAAAAAPATVAGAGVIETSGSVLREHLLEAASKNANVDIGGNAL